jgi:hypothetical protein
MKENGHVPSHVVSYFEHERDKSRDFTPHLEEIQAHGFNTVVFCVSEETLYQPQRLNYISNAVRQAKDAELLCLADPWSIGKVFGGEGVSPYAHSGDRACLCHPRFDSLMTAWVDTMNDAGFDGVFWDEPEAHCQEHDEIALVERYSSYAAEKGMKNSVCIPANEKNIWQLEELAKLSSIDEIGADPYWPNVFTKIPREERNEYAAFWAKEVREAAKKYDKKSGVWKQGFGIKKGDLQLLQEFGEVFRNSDVDYIGFWGFRGCETTLAELHTEVTKHHETATPQEIWMAAKTIFTSKLAA